jgi:hypothetical protein
MIIDKKPPIKQSLFGNMASQLCHLKKSRIPLAFPKRRSACSPLLKILWTKEKPSKKAAKFCRLGK